MYVIICHMCDKVEGKRLLGCYYLFGKITAMVEAHEDHRLVQLQETHFFEVLVQVCFRS